MPLSTALGAPRVVDVVPTLQTLNPEDVAGRVAVVIDVLRATSTIVAALGAGARDIRPVATPEEAQARLARLEASRGSREGLLLGGEREGFRLPGFDLGNSPLEYTPKTVAGKTIIFTTTNGTQTLRRAAGAHQPILVASFLNASAVAERLWTCPTGIVMACAGTRGGFSLEDTLLAGFLVDRLEKRAADPGAAVGDTSAAPGPFVFRDLARSAATLYRTLAGGSGEDLARVVVTADHARYLTSRGFGADVAYCASLDLLAVVPEYARGRVTLTAAGRRPVPNPRSG